MVAYPTTGSTPWNATLKSYIDGSDLARAPRVAPRSIPDVTTLANNYEASRFRYNWKASNTRKLRASIGVATAPSLAGALGGGPTGLVRWAFWGDSKTSGSGVSTMASPPMLTGAMFTKMAGLVVAGNSGNIFVDATADTRWVIGTGWTNQQLFRQWSTTATASTFTSDIIGTKVDIQYFNNSGQFSYTVKNNVGTTISGPTTVVPTGASSLAKVSLTGLVNAQTVVITPTAGTGGFFVGVDVYNAAGLLVHNFGSVGTTTSSWTAASFSSPASIAAFCAPTPSAVFIEIGVNDAVGGVALATFQANIASIVATAKALSGSPDVVLLTQVGGSAVVDATWQTYVAAIYAVADSANVPLIDIDDAFGSEATAAANGLMLGDNLHENAAGTQRVASLIFAACAAL